MRQNKRALRYHRLTLIVSGVVIAGVGLARMLQVKQVVTDTTSQPLLSWGLLAGGFLCIVLALVPMAWITRATNTASGRDMTEGQQAHSSLPEARPAHHAYLNLSLLLLAIRELWLRHRAKGGVPVEATVELAYHTDPVAKKVFRAEMRYSYGFEGRQFSGRVARDYFLNFKAADKLASLRRGEKVIVLVKPDQPEISYYASGFGFIEAIVFAPLILFTCAFCLIVPPLLVWAFLINK